MRIINFKFAGLILALCGLAFVASCDKDENNKDENNKSAVALPSGLTVGAITATTAELFWTSDTTEFEVRLGENGMQPSTFTSIITPNFRASSLTPNTIYTWQVRAKKGEAYSEWVAGQMFTTNTPIPAPTNLSVTNITQTGAEFSWTGNANAYELKVGSSTYATTSSSCAVNNLQGSTMYFWQVRAQGDEGYSDWAPGEVFITKFSPFEEIADVTFGDYTWRAAYVLAEQGTYTTKSGTTLPFWQIIIASINAEGDLTYPYAVLSLDGDTVVGRYSYNDVNYPEEGKNYDVKYYHESTITVQTPQGNYYVGDYWLNGNTTTTDDTPSYFEITAATSWTVPGGQTKHLKWFSGKFEGTLLDTYTYLNSNQTDFGNPVHLEIELKEVPVILPSEWASQSAGSVGPVGAPAALRAVPGAPALKSLTRN
ncbi:MAG: fibronectin type III domain-containing protein [Prevotellaceae bacterium]|jgi:hypothetical protein|nr:fibronectin type III domain-containing protein [Prevotellaceae bacterium]